MSNSYLKDGPVWCRLDHQSFSPPPTLKELVSVPKTAFQRRHWFHLGVLRVYVRWPSQRLLSGVMRPTLDIASVEVPELERGKGHFTRFLEWAESLDRIVFVESVLNERLARFLRRRGYRQHDLNHYWKDFSS